jgi:hypothetical protein
MTLQQFLTLTAGMTPSTEILVLDMWGNLGPAALVTIEDLVEGDPLRDDFPPNSIVIAEDADLTDRTTL